MRYDNLKILGPIILEPEIYTDERGLIFTSYNKWQFDMEGIEEDFEEEVQTHSIKNVLRGLHCQNRPPQSKLVRVLVGEIFDVVVDIRLASPTFGEWTSVNLSAQNKKQLYIPVGFAHGYYVLSDYAVMLYKFSVPYNDKGIITVWWNDDDIGINWPIEEGTTPIISQKDKAGWRLFDVAPFVR